jgi:hypothetical protein
MKKMSVLTLTEPISEIVLLQKVVTYGGDSCTLMRIVFDSKRLKAYAAS